MQRLFTSAGLVALGTLLVAAPAVAQTIPMHSGHMGHGSAQMRPNGSGLHHPNRPKYHHHAGHAGYRDVYAARKGGQSAFEANVAE